MDLFESIYFTFVTLSTVGFGDIYPDIWPSQLFMLCVITAALLILPTQVISCTVLFLLNAHALIITPTPPPTPVLKKKMTYPLQNVNFNPHCDHKIPQKRP